MTTQQFCHLSNIALDSERVDVSVLFLVGESVFQLGASGNALALRVEDGMTPFSPVLLDQRRQLTGGSKASDLRSRLLAAESDHSTDPKRVPAGDAPPPEHDPEAADTAQTSFPMVSATSGGSGVRGCLTEAELSELRSLLV